MTMTCPKCQGSMRQYERNAVTIDQCTECRGLFLDRGELERLIDAEAAYNESASDGPAAPPAAPAAPPPGPPPAPAATPTAPPPAPGAPPPAPAGPPPAAPPPAPPAPGGYGAAPPPAPGYGHGHGSGYQSHYRPKRRKSFLENLFDD